MSSMMEHMERERIRENILQVGKTIFKMELTEEEIKHVEDQFIIIFKDISDIAEGEKKPGEEKIPNVIGYLFDILLSVMTYNSILVSKLDGTREND
jgi:hypothetical protein